MPRPASPLRGRILNYLRRYVGEHDHGPTIRQIMDALNVSSTSVVEYHLVALEKRGQIQRGRDINGRAQARLLNVLAMPEQRGELKQNNSPRMKE
ncbi:MAG: winged helix DNA-binding protein [Anaerolineaceae bacterium]|nr:winged helix DNA-binding protein [Anaerolineaceae bacterium]